MSSRLLSTSTSPPYRHRHGGDADQPTTGRLSRRCRRRQPCPYGPEQRAASMACPPSPVSDHVPSPPSANRLPLPSSPPYAGVVGCGLDTLLQPKHEQELRSDSMSRDQHTLSPQPLDATDVGVQPQHPEEQGQESGSELDSPPRTTMLPEPENQDPDSPTSPPCPQSQHLEEQDSGSESDSPPRITMLPEPENQEPDSPTSPPGAACPVRVNPAGSPKDSPNVEEDQHFNYLVDNFVSAAADVCNSSLSDDETDYKEHVHRKSVLCAESALKHYNNDEKNKIKYDLISGIVRNDMLIREGYFSHVNFTAKGDQLNAKEDLFFAELRWNHGTPVPTCVICLEGVKKIGGLCDSKYDKFYWKGLPIDRQHCYACDRLLKHPKNGELYEMGHVAMSKHYWDD